MKEIAFLIYKLILILAPVGIYLYTKEENFLLMWVFVPLFKEEK